MAHDGRLGARGRRRFAHQGARGAKIRPPRPGGPFVIETVSAFYAFTRTPAGWKMFAISDVVLSA